MPLRNLFLAPVARPFDLAEWRAMKAAADQRRQFALDMPTAEAGGTFFARRRALLLVDTFMLAAGGGDDPWGSREWFVVDRLFAGTAPPPVYYTLAAEAITGKDFNAVVRRPTIKVGLEDREDPDRWELAVERPDPA